MPASPSASAPAATTAVESPPAAPIESPDTGSDDARRRLFELRSTLTQRFDRKSWDEYIRLRRSTPSV